MGHDNTGAEVGPSPPTSPPPPHPAKGTGAGPPSVRVARASSEASQDHGFPARQLGNWAPCSLGLPALPRSPVLSVDGVLDRADTPRQDRHERRGTRLLSGSPVVLAVLPPEQRSQQPLQGHHLLTRSPWEADHSGPHMASGCISPGSWEAPEDLGNQPSHPTLLSAELAPPA